MRARPYRVVGNARLARLQAQARDALALWADGWGVAAGETLAVVVAPMAGVRDASSASHPWRQSWTGAAGTAWCDWGGEAPLETKKLVFPGDGMHDPEAGFDPLAREGAAIAFDDLIACLRSVIFRDGAEVALLRQLDKGVTASGSGALALTVTVGRALLRLVADGDCVLGLPGSIAAPTLPSLAPVRLGKALDRIPVALTVGAGHVELGAGTLLGVGVGDVIALPLALDSPMSLALAGQEVCKGFIGRRCDRLAVEVVKA